VPFSTPPTPTATLAPGSVIYTYNGHTQVLAVAWSPSGKRVASGSRDTTVQVWDAATGEQIFTYHGHTAGVTSVSWSPDGKYTASGSSDKTMQVWDSSTGGLLYTYRGHTEIHPLLRRPETFGRTNQLIISNRDNTAKQRGVRKQRTYQSGITEEHV
jgi:WD40 repeat protein